MEMLLRRLPTEQRVAVLLRDAYDYEMEEIARLQGCGLSAAKMRVSRGRSALRRLFVDAEAQETVHSEETSKRRGTG
jgi:DNA-directed RNA polymerase specialized sigma24 family protein